MGKLNYSHLARFSAMQTFLANLRVKTKTYFKFAVPRGTNYQKLLPFSPNAVCQGASLKTHSTARTTTESFPQDTQQSL